MYGRDEKAYKIGIRKPARMRPLGRLGKGGRITLKCILK
jgi:hypothetical protein